MEITVFCSYNVLAHEKKPFYSVHAPASDISEKVAITIPDKVIDGMNEFDEPILKLDGMKYLLSEVLTNAGDAPVLRWYDGHTYKTIKV